jgi:ACR3 family arsenite efflux pump ArsB
MLQAVSVFRVFFVFFVFFTCSTVEVVLVTGELHFLNIICCIIPTVLYTTLISNSWHGGSKLLDIQYQVPWTILATYILEGVLPRWAYHKTYVQDSQNVAS